MSGFSADDSFFSLSKSTTLHNTKNFPKVSNAPKLQSQLPLNHTNLTKKAEKVKAKDPQTKVIVKKEEQLTLKKFSFILDTKKINSQEVILIDDEDVKPLNLSHESINNKPKAKESKMTTTGKRVALCDLEEVIEDEVTKKQKLSGEKLNLFPIKTAFKQHTLTPFKPVPGTKPEHTSIVAIDCEMVNCEGGIHALARCSIVDYNGHVLFDKLIKPKWRVTNYLTWVSGITPAKLRDAGSYDQYIGEIIGILQNKIIVGHSIKNDFDALNYYPKEKYVRDLVKYKGLKPDGKIIGLKKMTEIFLGMHIQDGQHNSVEDARATMALYRIVEKEWENDIKHSNYGMVQTQFMFDLKKVIISGK